MRKFASALCIVLAVSGMAHSLPQYGQQTGAVPQRTPSAPHTQRAPADPNHLSDGCEIVYKDFNVIVHEEINEEVCTSHTERVCDKKYRQVCNPYEDTECRTVFKRVCAIKQRQECRNLEREVPEQYEEEECDDKLVKACEFHWVIKGGDKVWEEDPHNCKEIPETQCQLVKKTRSKLEKYRDCRDVPYDDCQNVPDQECRKVTKNKCEQQAYDDCRDVTRPNCKTVHKKVPHTKKEKRPVRVCKYANDDGDDYDYDNFDDVDVVINSGKSNGPRFGGGRGGNVKDEYDGHKFTFSN